MQTINQNNPVLFTQSFPCKVPHLPNSEKQILYDFSWCSSIEELPLGNEMPFSRLFNSFDPYSSRY